MMRSARLAWPATAALIIASVQQPAHGQAAGELESASLRPGGFHEECLELEAGQAIAYAFSTSAPIAFNVHYHRGDDVLYLEEQDATDAGEGTLTAPSAENYCLMWENRTQETVELRYRGGVAAE